LFGGQSAEFEQACVLFVERQTKRCEALPKGTLVFRAPASLSWGN
jgi:hypothetical protein